MYIRTLQAFRALGGGGVILNAWRIIRAFRTLSLRDAKRRVIILTVAVVVTGMVYGCGKSAEKPGNTLNSHQGGSYNSYTSQPVPTTSSNPMIVPTVPKAAPTSTSPQTAPPDYPTPNFHGYDCSGDCSGHEAGYEWAYENAIHDPDECDGNSDSFIEGCRIYANEWQAENESGEGEDYSDSSDYSGDSNSDDYYDNYSQSYIDDGESQ